MHFLHVFSYNVTLDNVSGDFLPADTSVALQTVWTQATTKENIGPNLDPKCLTLR